MHQKTSWTMPIVTIVAVVVAIILAFIGSGALGGTPVAEAASGALSADATPVAPASAAFSIWSVIYLGLAVYAVYQLLPAQRASARHAALRPWAALSALLNAGWLAVVQADSVGGSVAVIVILLLVLLRILVILQSGQPNSWLDMVITDGTFGLYLGWVIVAATANAVAWIMSDMEPVSSWELVAAIILAALTVAGIALAFFSGGRIAPALAMSWGLAWVAVARTGGDFESIIVVIAAATASALILLTTVIRKFRWSQQEAKNQKSVN